MNSWRLRIRVLPWLLAPALAAAACGHTDSGDKPSGAGQGGSASGAATSGSASVVGGKGPTAGMTGRGGSQVVPEAGTGGTSPAVMIPGISQTPQTQACGVSMCNSAAVGPLFVDPCCAGEACGLDTSGLALLGIPFQDRCQALDQPGDVDPSCPTSAGSTVPVPLGGQTIMLPVNGFAGCCREDGKCGVVANDIVSPLIGTVATLGLGCVDSAPFFGNQPAAACGGGVGGAGGAGGAPAEPGGASAGGEAGASVSAAGAG
ncbi:MAG: hypothetical protein ABUL60_34770 [Myxococcales bacterium]